jgi:hypothetical protein
MQPLTFNAYDAHHSTRNDFRDADVTVTTFEFARAEATISVF